MFVIIITNLCFKKKIYWFSDFKNFQFLTVINLYVPGGEYKLILRKLKKHFQKLHVTFIINHQKFKDNWC